MAARAALSGLMLAVLASGASAQQGETTAEIRIALPSDATPLVSLSPGRDSIVLVLPGGAQFPEDFAASSGGMLRQGSVEHDGDRVKLELELVRGQLDNVIYEPRAVVLNFRSSRLPQVVLADEEGRYLLGPDDRIGLTVHNHPDLSSELDISRSGWITAPLVGEVKAGGLTPGQLAARLAELLDGHYLVNPRVDVSVVDYRSQWVVVGGEVLKPGRIPLRGGTRLKEVLGEAEGFSDDAGEEITITRRILNSEETRTLRVSRDEYENGRSNPTLQNGDIIDVKRAEYCYIQGEVQKSGRVRIERGMTLLRVIALAQGLTDWADRKNVRVLYGEGAVPKERVFNLNKIERGKTEDPPMRGGENIIVKKRFL